MAPVLSPVTQRAVYLPEGEWVDYWSGKQLPGRQTMAVDAPLDRLPLYVRSGAILPKIPEDVMTLVAGRSICRQKRASRWTTAGCTKFIHRPIPVKLEAIQDFEGRTIRPGAEAGTLDHHRRTRAHHSSLAVRGSAERDGKRAGVPVVRSAEGVSVEFEHTEKTALNWRP